MIKLKYLASPKLLLQYYRKYNYEKTYKDVSLTIGLGSSLNNSTVGTHVYIGENCQVNNSMIGDHSYLNNNTELNGVSLGRFCSIASDVIIGMGMHPSHFVSTHPAFYSNNKAFETFADTLYYQEYQTVEIGNDVWIGNGVRIMGGISIGDGAIIATGAVVTKDVPPYAIYGGVPAKLIKYRFDEVTITDLLRIKWWEMDLGWIKANYKLFLNTSDLIKRF